MTFLHLESISLSSNYIVLRYIVIVATRAPPFLISMGLFHEATAMEIQHAARGRRATGAGGRSGDAAGQRPQRARAQRAESAGRRNDRRDSAQGSVGSTRRDAPEADGEAPCAGAELRSADDARDHRMGRRARRSHRIA